MRTISQIILHCSDSGFGNAELIDAWHRERGWEGIGYHFVICNGQAAAHSVYDAATDGLVQTGRPEMHIGAHAKGHNAHSLGVCLIGEHRFTGMQFVALQSLLRTLQKRHHIAPAAVLGHCELDQHKTCPNLPMAWIRAVLAQPA